MSSPTCAFCLSNASPGGTSPNAVMQMFKGPCVVSPPTSSQWCSLASCKRPSEKPSSQTSSMRGRDKASVNAVGSAPQAARSLKLTASDLWPRRAGSTVLRKWRPSTNISLDIAICMPGVGASKAQSSPTPSTARCVGRLKYRAIKSNSPMA